LQYGYGNDSEEDELHDSEEDTEEVNENADEEVVEEEQDDWKWEDEEDYTLGHVWPGGLDIHRGLIYVRSKHEPFIPYNSFFDDCSIALVLRRLI
jgi:hypothetical protein